MPAVVTVTTAGGQDAVVRVTTRRTPVRRAAEATVVRRTTRFL